MKIRTLFVAALVGILATACNKENVIPEQDDMSVKTPITITANYSGGDAKVSYTEDGANINATWETGDELYVVYNGAVNTLTLSDGAGTSSATFTGTILGSPSATSMLLCYVKDNNAPSAVTVNSDGSYTYTDGTFTSQDGTLASAAKCNLYYGVATYGDGSDISCTFSVNTSMMKFSVATGLAENTPLTLSYKSDGTTIASANFNVGADGTATVYMSIPAGKYTGAQTLVCNDGSTNATATLSATQANFAAGETYSKPFVFLFSGTGEITATDGAIIAGTGGSYTHFYIAADATVTLCNVTEHTSRDWAGITCLGNATINLVGTNEVQGYKYPGIYAAHNFGSGDEYTLTIQGSGSLNAISEYDASAIGGRKYDEGRCGNIEIKGGTITAKGAYTSVGIGAAYSSQCGDITISGGNVSSEIWNEMVGGFGAAIGAGYQATCGNITISGGTVTATTYGGGNAAIGGGRQSHCGDIIITSNVTKVTATKTGLNFIGAGDDNGTCGTVTIDGVTNATPSSTFTHFNSTLSTTNSTNDTWTLTHN